MDEPAVGFTTSFSNLITMAAPQDPKRQEVSLDEEDEFEEFQVEGRHCI